jgi:hypothetical protein
MDRSLEQQRGQMAKLHLQVLIAAARSVHLIDWEAPLKNGGRRLATLLLDGRDVRDIALAEGWGVDYRARKDVDWGDKALPFSECSGSRPLSAFYSRAGAICTSVNCAAPIGVSLPYAADDCALPSCERNRRSP